MVEIKYFYSQSSLQNCFEFELSPIEDYLPGIDGRTDSCYTLSAYEYYNWLFQKYNLFWRSTPKREINMITWECLIDGIPFKMTYDENIDSVYFSVDVENIIYLNRIADRIKKLIEDDQ